MLQDLVCFEAAASGQDMVHQLGLCHAPRAARGADAAALAGEGHQFLLHAVEVCLFNLLLQGIPNLNCCKR